MRLLLKRRKFSLQDVDEFRTSKTCSTCLGELKSYRKHGGRLSHSRLFCPTCSLKRGHPAFVDRDVNAAANILLAGTSPSRPEALSRTHTDFSDISAASLVMGEKSKSEDAKDSERIKLPLDAGRPSSDPTFMSVCGPGRIYPSLGPKGLIGLIKDDSLHMCTDAEHTLCVPAKVDILKPFPPYQSKSYHTVIALFTTALCKTTDTIVTFSWMDTASRWRAS